MSAIFLLNEWLKTFSIMGDIVFQALWISLVTTPLCLCDAEAVIDNIEQTDVTVFQ